MSSRAAGWASAAPIELPSRLSAWRSMRLPAKPTNWLGSRSGASKRRNMVGRSAEPCMALLQRRADFFAEAVQVGPPIGLAHAMAPDGSGPSGVALAARDDM